MFCLKSYLMCKKLFEYFISPLKSNSLDFYIQLDQEQVNLNSQMVKFGGKLKNTRFEQLLNLSTHILDLHKNVY